MASINRENYLKQLYLLQQDREGAVPMGALASTLKVASASVTGMVKALVDSGLVKYERYKGVSLTPEGWKIAVDVIRRHRLIEAFLVRTLGIDWSQVHEEAEALEHAVSEKLLDRIDDYLGRPTVDPHGDPIPAANGKVKRGKGRSLLDFPAGARLRVVRVTDQDEGFLRFVDRIGLRPGTQVMLRGNDAQAQIVTLAVDKNKEVTLAAPAASKLLVEAC